MISSALMAAFTGLAALTQAAPLDAQATSLEARAGGYYYFNATVKTENGNSTFNGQHLSLRYADPSDHNLGYLLSLATQKKNSAQFQQTGNGDSLIVVPSPGIAAGAKPLYIGLPQVEPFYQGNDTATFPSAPGGYYDVSSSPYNQSQATGFEIVDEDKTYTHGTLVYVGSNATNFGTFAVCNCRREDGSNNYQPRFLWRTSTSSADTTGQCADVKVRITYEN